MKIGPLESPATATKPAAAERKSGAAPAPAQASAQVELSSAASLGSAAPEAADASFDSAKVDRIAQAIRDGQFTVNAEAIADKLIINAAELLGRKPAN